VMLISTGGTVIKMAAENIKRSGRSTQGVIVMRLRGDDEHVSALAPVVESDETAEDVGGEAEVEIETPVGEADASTNGTEPDTAA
jgi:DNA gyrase subunit A